VNNKLGARTSILGGRDRERSNNDDTESTEGLREEDGNWQNRNIIKTMDVDIQYLPSV
jgi:hypothetical protein